MPAFVSMMLLFHGNGVEGFTTIFLINTIKSRQDLSKKIRNKDEQFTCPCCGSHDIRAEAFCTTLRWIYLRGLLCNPSASHSYAQPRNHSNCGYSVRKGRHPESDETGYLHGTSWTGFGGLLSDM